MRKETEQDIVINLGECDIVQVQPDDEVATALLVCGNQLVHICRTISALTVRRYGSLPAETVVECLNRTLSGWANYFRLGQISPAYRAVDQHADRRLRQWLCRKHKVRSGKCVRFPSQQVYEQYGLHRLAPTRKGLPRAKA